MLNTNQANDLVHTCATPGFQVILDIMERECKLFETDLINAPSGDSNKIVAAHSQAKAAWQFFVRVQKTIEHEVREALGAKPKEPLPIPDHLISPFATPEDIQEREDA